MYNAKRGKGNMIKTNKIEHRLLPTTLLIFYHKVRTQFNAIKIKKAYYIVHVIRN
jgi:hypothetical protein